MLPPFDSRGLLPPGVHWASWTEIEVRLGTTSHRRRLLAGFLAGVIHLRSAGCKVAYLDGSFVTRKRRPGDFDACWDVDGVDLDQVHPVLLEFAGRRATQKELFGGEFLPAQVPDSAIGKTFLALFQIDRKTGAAKGIVALNLETLLT